MTDTLRDVYSSIESNRCRDGKCHVKLQKSFTVYCGEKLRDRVMGNNATPMKMCDCIIADSSEGCMSVVELKFRRGSKGIFKGKRKAGRIDDVREQFTGGLIVLRQILEKISRQYARVQMVLYTRNSISDRSELKKLRKPLNNVTGKLCIANASCGAKLPAGYVRVPVQGLPTPA